MRVVILAAAGKGFCAGHDLKEIRALKELPKIERLFGQCSRMMQTITALPQPVIARVQGRGSRCGLPARRPVRSRGGLRSGEVHHARRHLGILLLDPGVAVGRNVSRKRAMEMLLTGDLIDARRALDWGLVNRVVPAEAGGGALQLRGESPGEAARHDGGRKARLLSADGPRDRQGLRPREPGHLLELRPCRRARRHGRLHRQAPPPKR